MGHSKGPVRHSLFPTFHTEHVGHTTVAIDMHHNNLCVPGVKVKRALPFKMPFLQGIALDARAHLLLLIENSP